MLKSLKQRVYVANLALSRQGLAVLTWGNASGVDRERGLAVIKPSGLPYEELSPEKMAVVDLDGKVVEGDFKPSSDTPTHLALYRAFPALGGIVHTHSRWATVWAQAGRGIPPLGTTHGDYFYGEIPCTRRLKHREIQGDYEKNTGLVIVETLNAKKLDPVEMPAALVASHGPFTWGRDCMEAVHNAVVLETLAEMALKTTQISGLMTLNPAQPMQKALLDKHFLRKHGKNAYYGQ